MNLNDREATETKEVANASEKAGGSTPTLAVHDGESRSTESGFVTSLALRFTGYKPYDIENFKLRLTVNGNNQELIDATKEQDTTFLAFRSPVKIPIGAIIVVSVMYGSEACWTSAKHMVSAENEQRKMPSAASSNGGGEKAVQAPPSAAMKWAQPQPTVRRKRENVQQIQNQDRDPHRLAQNRVAAQKSRERKKEFIVQLEQQLHEMSCLNADLCAQLEQLVQKGSTTSTSSASSTTSSQGAAGGLPTMEPDEKNLEIYGKRIYLAEDRRKRAREEEDGKESKDDQKGLADDLPPPPKRARTDEGPSVLPPLPSLPLQPPTEGLPVLSDDTRRLLLPKIDPSYLKFTFDGLSKMTQRKVTGELINYPGSWSASPTYRLGTVTFTFRNLKQPLSVNIASGRELHAKFYYEQQLFWESPPFRLVSTTTKSRAPKTKSSAPKTKSSAPKTSAFPPKTSASTPKTNASTPKTNKVQTIETERTAAQPTIPPVTVPQPQAKTDKPATSAALAFQQLAMTLEGTRPPTTRLAYIPITQMSDG